MATITSQWWRHLVNAYEVKAGMVRLQCKNCVIHTLNASVSFLQFTIGCYTNQCAFTFTLALTVDPC